MKLITRAALLVLSLCLPATVYAQTSETAQQAAPKTAKQEKIRQLLVLMDSARQGEQAVDMMIETMKPMSSETPDEFWAELKKSIAVDELMNLIAPIYDEHLTEKEIDDLIAFYSSPSGRSYVQKQPAIMQESFAAGQEWGVKIMQEITDKIEAREKAKS